MTLSDKEIDKLLHPLYSFWSNGIDRLWIAVVKRAFNKKGLLYYENEAEEMIVRERLVLSAVIYYEFCYKTSFHENENFSNWSEDLVQTIKKDFSQNVNENLHIVARAMVDFFGSERFLFHQLWLNCDQAQKNVHYTIDETERLVDDISGDLSSGDPNKNAGYNFLFNIDSIDKLESISY